MLFPRALYLLYLSLDSVKCNLLYLETPAPVEIVGRSYRRSFSSQPMYIRSMKDAQYAVELPAATILLLDAGDKIVGLYRLRCAVGRQLGLAGLAHEEKLNRPHDVFQKRQPKRNGSEIPPLFVVVAFMLCTVHPICPHLSL